ncbi:MAG TPA: glycosyltransferase [Actinomycetota bacterium]|nr:glycosyltransferase [Actinomycetota bacterium]
MARVAYLTFDSLAEGVGRSQVLPYVERFVERGVDVELHTMEKAPPRDDIVRRLNRAGVRWKSHPFGRHGPLGGAARVARGVQMVRGASLVHARSDLPAASVLLARCPRWVWDVRSLWADQRIALGALRPGSTEDRALRRIERGAARRSSAIVTLTAGAIEVLKARHGTDVAVKAVVVPTCVDLRLFAPAPIPEEEPIRLVFSGTLNRFYDVPLMLRLAQFVRRRRPTQVRVVTPGPTSWEPQLATAGVERVAGSSTDMADHVSRSHAGLSVCRPDAGVSLRAAAPTKLAEFLAGGRPVIVNRGLGDMDDVIERFRCGVVVRGSTDDDLEEAAAGLEALIDDPQTPRRCREAAEAHFDLDKGVDRLVAIYRTLADR